jgi:hypothetical protein
MARSIDPLVVGRVVGDVIDMFVPSVDLAVQYTSRQVKSSFHVIGDERSKVLIFFFLFFGGAFAVSSTRSALHIKKGLEIYDLSCMDYIFFSCLVSQQRVSFSRKEPVDLKSLDRC